MRTKPSRTMQQMAVPSRVIRPRTSCGDPRPGGPRLGLICPQVISAGVACPNEIRGLARLCWDLCSEHRGLVGFGRPRWRNCQPEVHYMEIDNNKEIDNNQAHRRETPGSFFGPLRR